MNKIAEALNKLFEEHRVIFWYDEKEELREQFEELELSGVEKVVVQGNEFEIKYIINKQKPETRFLLYFPATRPANEENWLLDMELAFHVFHTDQEAMFLQELELGYHLKEFVAEHIEFFKSKERRQKLKELIGKNDDQPALRYKMLSVVFGTENLSLETFIHAHASALANENEKFDKELQRFSLHSFYWNEITNKYNYHNDSPSIYDFLIELFSGNFVLGRPTNLSKESRLLLSLWKDSLRFRESFAQISDKIAGDLDVERLLDEAGTDEIIHDDLFRLTDYKIIHDLVDGLISETISAEKTESYIKQRENKFWFPGVELLYKSVGYAAEMIALIRLHGNTQYDSFEAGTRHYAGSLFEIDKSYRKFILNYRLSGQKNILSLLADKVEKIYSNDWLLTYNNNWQKIIDGLEEWPNHLPESQQNFFTNFVRPFTVKKQRLFVIISDALRYETGEELNKKLQTEKRFEASPAYMISSLPSYTQLGMASLLPHKELAFQEESDIVLVDNIPSTGIQGRAKILNMNAGVRATAIQAEELMRMNASTEGREYVKQYDLIYIFHNRIDKTGDDKTTEERVFEATEDELDFLIELMKKIAAMNGNNMLVTSDHGFVYQHSELNESDFSVSVHTGEVWKESRRFVIGKNLKGDNSTKAFKASRLNIATDADVLIPKSINRLRIKGAGSRFVHGGATLQEIVIPLIRVSKKRQDTTTQVDVDIIKSTDRITTNLLAVSFIQSGLVTDTVLPRTIRAGIYAEDGELLSDLFKYNFDIEEGSERQREVKHRFQLSSKASGKYKNQRVKLLLEEPVAGTNRWKPYREYLYTLNISFTNDFDDF
jgi:uncharacterized protein (TIGR02687 family)